jgi:type II secretory pathway pseudopilin PulG
MILKSKSGFSMVEALVAVGILSVVMFGLISFIQNQNKEVGAIDEKMALQSLQTQISNVLSSPAFCGCFIGTHTFNYTTKTWNTFPTTLSTSYNGICGAVGASLVAVGTKIGNKILPTAINMQSIAETTTGSGSFNANLEVQFDQNLLTRSRKNVSVPVFFNLKMTDPIGARGIDSCGTIVPSSTLSLKQTTCIDVTYVSTGRAMCPMGYYVAGVHDDGGGLDGLNGIVCCVP